MADQVGLLGGSFDPIHFGHLVSARGVAEALGLSRVVLIPAGTPPHKRDAPITPAHHRLAMTRLAAGDDKLFEVSSFEVDRPGPSYTIETVKAFIERAPGPARYCWMIGADSLAELPTWHRISELVELVDIVAAGRPLDRPVDRDQLAAALGGHVADRLIRARVSTPLIDISSSEIRDRVCRKLSIRYLVPELVRSYIYEHGLYHRTPPRI